VAEHLGLHQEDESEGEEHVLTPAECHGCGEINSFEADTCRSCGEALRTGDLIQKFQIQEKKKQFKDEIIKSDTDFDNEIINEKAKEFVRKEFDLS
jgi:ribosomal protein L40E